MFVSDTQVIHCGTSRYIRQFNETFVMSDIIKCYTCFKSWKLGQILHGYAV